MRFFEFATTKPRKPKKPRKPTKPMTPDQAVVAAYKRDVDVAKQALQSVKDHQKERKEAERARHISYAGTLQQSN
ncbi:hypothetical protein F1640_11310 [Novosphingobium sp. NBM11]|uniref:hypothetical protein n=1 Tax=Novosphingobium sp. NBM11 TaxID=2596914 RepID=UPI00189225BE|nr:hypothetical protein [Novosphingobium sp. NBM11]MBF5090590.1 hypothetical protein [Novosphingobium sp. NBM11]